jgi:tripartite-type tricarboxylate transporter receptor subunit TctC
MADVNERMNALGIPRRGGDAASFAQVLRADSERYGRLVREFNISAQ